MVGLAHEHHAVVEVTLGSLLGREETQTHAASLTEPETAATFVQHPGVDVLAVYVGNEHVLGVSKLNVSTEVRCYTSVRCEHSWMEEQRPG